MKSFIPALFLMLCSCLPAQAASASFNGVQPAIIVDVRTTEEFSGGHIAGALNIPLDRLMAGIRSIPGITKDSVILVYCRSGHRAALAVQALEGQGYKRVMNGGGLNTLSRDLQSCSANQC